MKLDNMDEECHCEGKLKKIMQPYSMNIPLGKFEALKCEKCKSVYFTEESMEKIEKEAKKRGVWGWNKDGRFI